MKAGLYLYKDENNCPVAKYNKKLLGHDWQSSPVSMLKKAISKDFFPILDIYETCLQHERFL